MKLYDFWVTKTILTLSHLVNKSNIYPMGKQPIITVTVLQYNALNLAYFKQLAPL